MNMINPTVITEIEEADRVSLVFKALASQPRRKILAVLRDGEQCVCHIKANTGYRQAYISQQLKVLRSAGLIADQRDGWNIYYRVVVDEVFRIVDMTLDLIGQQTELTIPPKPTCPCPKCNPDTLQTNQEKND